MCTRRVNGKNCAVVISATLLTIISVGLVQAGALRALSEYQIVQAAIEDLLVVAGAFPDCNENGVDDAQDIVDLTSPDCDSNGEPDECQILVSSGAAGGPFFCNADCDPDCNGTGIPDACELTGNDCNGDGTPDECGVPIECSDSVLSFEDQKLAAFGEAEGDLFGTSVSADGNLAVVGAYLDDLVGCTDCGSAYVYRFDGSSWLQEAQLIASDAAPDGRFGWSVSINGNKIVVGASGDDCAAGLNCGAAYVFRFDGNQWIEEAKLVAGDAAIFDRFGYSVSIHVDGILVGARTANCSAGVNCGAAYVFRYDDMNADWVQEAKLVASDAAANDEFGTSAAISGGAAVIGAPSADCLAGDDCGAAYVFRYDTSIPEWVEEAKIIASDAAELDTFGEAVSIESNTIIVGAPLVDCPHPSGPNCGAAYINRYDDTIPGWVEEAKLTVMQWGDRFGTSVSIDGHTIAVGAPLDFVAKGVAYVFRYNSGTQVWNRYQDLFASVRESGDGFGRSIAVSGNSVIVGADFAECCGTAYTFDLTGPDCNCNGTVDLCDITDCSGDLACADCNNNGLPDECDVSISDCNGNEIPDDCDIDSGTSNDCNLNGIPDECEPLGDDCNGNLIIDECDTDCNLNGVPDDCDVADGTSPDCQSDGIPDECELLGDFLDISPQLSPFGDNSPRSHTIPSAPVAGGNVTLFFTARANLRDLTVAVDVSLNGNPIGRIFELGTFCAPLSAPDSDHLVVTAAIYNAATSGGDAVISMVLTEDGGGNCGITMITVTTSYETLGYDCNNNGVPDTCDIADGTSQDCDGNAIPDDCGPDCNGNGVSDECDLFTGSSTDCNNNLIPDDCDLANCAGDPACADCNENSIPDGCDRVNNDCNENLIPDDCDVDACAGDPACADCNADGRPDECGVIVNCGEHEDQKVTAMNALENDFFGTAVAISEDVMIVGNDPAQVPVHELCQSVPSCGAAFVYRKNTLTGNWVLEQELNTEETQGFGVAVGIDGNIVVVGAPRAHRGPGANQDEGAAYLFHFNSNTRSWSQESFFPPSKTGSASRHGRSVAVSGTRVVIGSPGRNVGFATTRVLQGWTGPKKLAAPGINDGFGDSVAISGDFVLAGADTDDDAGNNAGAVFVFRFNSATQAWDEVQKLLAADGDANDRFGRAISIDHDLAIVGAYADDNEGIQGGSAYVFRYDEVTEAWVETQKLTASDAAAGDQFGYSASISGHTLVVGAIGDDNAVHQNVGAAYLFVYNSNTQTWNEVRKFTASDAAAGDSFGQVVSISGQTVVVGAPLDVHAGGIYAGSVYIFNLTSGDCTCDGTADACEPDNDGDGVPNGCDLCFGFDDADDADADGVPDGCDPCPLPDMDDTDGDGVCDLADICLGDDTVDLDGNGVPDACELEPPLGATAPHDRKKNRYLSFRPNNGGLVALRVTLLSSLNHPAAVGTSMWIGEPDTDGVAVLSPTPVTRLWPETTVHATGCFVSPVAAYEIRATFDDGASFSDPLLIQTIDQPGVKFWGDVVGIFNGMEWTAPQLVTNIDDAVAVIQTWQQLNGSPHTSVADVEPQFINKVVNFNDVLQVIFAFQGATYPFGCPDDPCQDNSIVPCG